MPSVGVGVGITFPSSISSAGGGGESTLTAGLVSAFLFEDAPTPYASAVGGASMQDADAPPTSGAGKNNLGLSESFIQGMGISLASSPAGDFSTSVWLKEPATPVQADQIFVHASNLGEGYLVTLTSGDVLNFFDGITDHQGTAAFTGGVYHNVICTYSQATQTHQVYLDGVLDLSFVATYTTGASITLQVGSTGGTLVHWDELYLWNRKLTAGEIVELQTTFYPF